MSTFTEMWQQRGAAGKYICIGLDPSLEQIPDCVPGDTDAERVFNFLADIIDATSHCAAAYKPQIAFFESLGDKGHPTLRRVIEYIRSVESTIVEPAIPVILDYKRADIGTTNNGYVTSGFDYFKADAVTVNPYFGMEAMKPFLDRADKTVVVLCRTSNPGAGEFQDVECNPLHELGSELLYSTLAEFERETGRKLGKDDYEIVPMPHYQFVAHRVAQSWNYNGNCAVVVGATAPQELGIVRDIVDTMPILLPGIGSQNGKMVEAFEQGIRIPEDVLVPNNASAINFAYTKIKVDGKLKYTPEQYAEAATEAAEEMNDAARTLRVV